MEGDMSDGLDLLDDWLEDIESHYATHDQFSAEVRERMENGRREYGDKSFGLPLTTILAEAQMEAVDLAGWPYMIWRKLKLEQRALLAKGLDTGPRFEQLHEALSSLEAIGWRASCLWSQMLTLVENVRRIELPEHETE